MPSPVLPDAIKDAIPSVNGNFCEKFLSMLKLPRLFYDWFAYTFTESGEFTDEAKADICALGCTGGTTPGGGGDATIGVPVIMASDGDFSDHVHIIWASVNNATTYQVFRNTINNVGNATNIATVSTPSYDDTTAEEGTEYFYWVRGVNVAKLGRFSNPDTGHTAGVIAAISDLEASHGLSTGISSQFFVYLQFSSVSGATHYDIYRGSTNVFSAATRIDTDRQPFDNSRVNRTCPTLPCTLPRFVDNGDSLAYTDKLTTQSQFTRFYYWVKPKRKSGSAVTGVGPESNSTYGWAVGDGSGVVPVTGFTLTAHDVVETIPAGITRAWIAIWARGASGAGGGSQYGGGGGGGGAIAAGQIPVVAGKHLKLFLTPSTPPAGGVSASDGQDGLTTELMYDGSGAYLPMLTGIAAAPGIYSAGGSGAGGDGGYTLLDASVTDQWAKNGAAGTAGSAEKGGRGGNHFGGARATANHLNGSGTATDTGAGATTGGGGGGSDAIPTAPSLAVGGDAGSGYAVVVYYTV